MKPTPQLSPLSIAGLGTAALSVGLVFSDAPQFSAWPGLAGLFMTQMGIGKRASFARFAAVLGAATLLAAAAALTLGPLVGVGVLLVLWGHFGRGGAFVTVFGTAGSWFLDPLMAFPGLGLVIAGALGLHGPAAWAAWALAAFCANECKAVYGNAVFAVHTQRHNRRGFGVEPGKPAPDFSLVDQDGFPVTLSAFKGRGHVLLIFVRGDWCPSCHITLRTYAKNKERFQEQGVTLLAIGPDPVGVNLRMVQELGVPYKMLSDTGQRTAMDYGVQLQDDLTSTVKPEGVPLPASFLVDKNGIVRYTSRPERAGEFLSPSTIFPVLQRLGA